MQHPRLKCNFSSEYNPEYKTNVRSIFNLANTITSGYNRYVWYYRRSYYINNGSVYWEEKKSYVVIKDGDNIYFNSKYKKELKSLFIKVMDSITVNPEWKPDSYFKNAVLNLDIQFKSHTEIKQSILNFKNYAKKYRITTVCRI